MLWQFWLLYYTFRNMHKSVLTQRSVGRGPGFSCGLEYPVVFCRGGHSLSFNRSHIFFLLDFSRARTTCTCLDERCLGAYIGTL